MATFVMAFGIATAIIVLQAGFKQLDLARSTTMASQILQSEMERIRMMSFGTVAALAASPPSTSPEENEPDEPETPLARIEKKYQLTTVVTPVPNRENDVMTITLTVTWNSFDGRPHRRTFSGLYAKNGLYDYYYTAARALAP